MTRQTEETAAEGQHGHGPGSFHHEGDLRELVMDATFWEQRYRDSDALWSGNPNPQLVAEVAGLTPGSALDVGCGEGADAIWLARQGWRVTAVDISNTALERGAAHARDAGEGVAGRITWLEANLVSWVPPVSTYDLVSAQFMQTPRDLREDLLHRLAASVTPAGSLLVVGHHPDDMHNAAAARPQVAELFYTAAEIAASLNPGDWDIVVSETRPRAVAGPEGHPTTIHDAVLRARRRS